MKGARAHFFDYWAPTKSTSELREKALFPGVISCQASKWQVKRRGMMMLRGTSFFSPASTTKQRVKMILWGLNRMVISNTYSVSEGSCRMCLLSHRSKLTILLLMKNTSRSSESTENSLLNKKPKTLFFGNIMLHFSQGEDVTFR